MTEPEQTSSWTIGERFRGWRLDRFLVDQIPKLSRSRIQKVIGERIWVSWKKHSTPSTRVQVGGTVYAGTPRLNEIPETYKFKILYEDEDFLAIDKPPGLVVHPTNQVRMNSIIEVLRRDLDAPELRLVHRLDRETSGVLLLARNASAAHLGGLAFKNKTLRKIYIARVHGVPNITSGLIDHCIGKDSKSRVFVRRKCCEKGERAITKWNFISSEKNTSILQLEPETGRRHQLRVHCESIGHPIVGDPLYGHPDQHYLDYIQGNVPRDRMHLHAWRLWGNLGGKRIEITAPPLDCYLQKHSIIEIQKFPQFFSQIFTN